MDVKFEGMAELVAKLQRAGAAMGGVEMKKALRAGGHVIQKAMQERAPVLDGKTPGSDSLEPGALKAGIRVFVPALDDPVEAIIGPSARVAHVARFVEYGHRQVSGGSLKLLGNGKTRGSGKASGKDVPAHPFLRPAFEASVGEVGKVIQQSLSESFKKVLS